MTVGADEGMPVGVVIVKIEYGVTNVTTEDCAALIGLVDVFNNATKLPLSLENFD